MNEHLKTIKDILQQNKMLSDAEKEALIKSINDADKQWNITEFKLDRTEKVKKTTSILLEETITELEQKRKAVEEQNRELEIESSLERVRTVAMSMNKPDDLLRICETVYGELQTLGFSELRNTMINIHDDDRGSFLNYDYSKDAGPTVTTILYNSHPATENLVKQIRTANDAFAEFAISGAELNEWRNYRKGMGEKDDPRLDNTDTLSYYFYSIGTGGIGISTYSSITEERRVVLKRFRNVFDLAYRRYIDIKQAEAQARESKIELALERVRARTMAMQRSDELQEAATLLFQQVQSLGIHALTCGYNIWEKNEKVCTAWMSAEAGLIQPSFNIPLTESPTFIRFYESRQKGESFYIEEVSGEALAAHYRYMLTLPVFGEMMEGFLKAGFTFPLSQINHVVNFSHGNLIFISYQPVPEAYDIFKRFAKVFEQTYTRFLDLKKAEAQSRESQIELALERVRARTMAMQKSDELLDVIAVLGDQLTHLNFKFDNVSFGEHNEDYDFKFWLIATGQAQPLLIQVPYLDNPAPDRVRQAQKKGLKFFADILTKEENQQWTQHIMDHSVIGLLPDKVKEYLLNSVGYARSTFILKNISLYVGNYKAIPYTEEDNNIFYRFAQVFEQSYTRFLDLKKAEAQSRESQIQLAMERVRARTMAMQHSDELGDVAEILFKQVHELGFKPWSAGFNIWQEGDDTCIDWVTNPAGGFMEPYTIDLTTHRFFRAVSDAKKRGEDFGAFEISGDALTETCALLMSFAPKQFGAMQASGITFPDRYINHYVFGKDVGLMFITPDPVPEAHDVFKRFGKVFEQTYTRFLDLKKAEAQTRESQIQLALERVRARTMAMQKSDELSETAVLLFHQLMSLGLDLRGCGFNIWEKDEKTCTAWMSGPDGTLSPPFNIPLTTNPFFIRYYESRQKGEDFWVYETSKEELAARYEYFQTLPVLAEMLTKEKKENAAIELPPFVVDHLVNFSNGNLVFITNQHHPEAHDIFKRFGKVFEQTYTRFLDLQKAEAQVREARIEAALEKVRSSSLAMHKSAELNDIVMVLFEKLKDLQIPVTAAGITIYTEGSKDMNMYVCGNIGNGLAINNYLLPYFDHPIINDLYDVHKNNSDFFVGNYSKEEKDSLYEYAFEYSALKDLPGEIKTMIMESPSYSIAMAPAKHSMINLNDFQGKVLSENEKDVLKRFSKVFEQAYIRFLDLQKAEAQARESQIQLALERVRARTMAMQNSNELPVAANLLFQQLQALGMPAWSAGYCIWDDDKQGITLWMSSEGVMQPSFHAPLTEDPSFIHMKDAYENGQLFHTEEVGGEELVSHYKHMRTLPGISEVLDSIINAGHPLPTFQIFHCAYFTQGFLLFITYEPVPEAHDIFKRFAKVFEQTYTRFLDLQRAEAQTREAKVEAALEKVRSRTMAMQKSDELGETATLLFKQVSELGIKAWTTGFNVWSDDNNFYTDYITSPQGNLIKAYTIDVSKSPSFTELSNAKKRGDEFYVQYLEGDQLKETYKTLSDFGNEKQYEKILEDGFTFPPHQYDHLVFGAKVSLMFITYEAVPEAHDIFIRFGKVFEQTYTRFLDLQRAEAQARESQIETALERVRSRSMGMQKSEELREVIQVVYEQLIHLNILVEHTGFIMDYKERNDMHIWLADKHAVPFQVFIPYFDCAHWNSFNEAKKKGNDFFANHLSFEEKNKFYKDLFKVIPGVPEETLEYYFSVPGLAISTVLLDNIGLYIENFSGVPYSDEENNTLMRFGKVFQQTYTRFLDLQKAEAQALEAIKRASVDRVRAEIASMRTTKDLERITPLIFNELTTVGVPFTRCGVFIMDEEQQKVQTLLSTPDGKAIATLHVPFDFDLSIISNGVSYWRKKKIYKEHWDAQAFIKSWTALSSLRDTSVSSSQSEHPPENLYLHLLPFLQGMLYVGNDVSLNDDELQLVQNLAVAFSTAYARYEDFNKLEVANVKIEKTLVDLKQTQTQLVQSEKMASLGELTAGIAHEIQNPLNFVNNFSDVNKELLAELTEEIEKGNYEEVKIIANDIINNEEKISHHGKRADSIVKGMLQHSRSTSTTKEPTNINALADEYLRLTYHGLRAKDKSFNATMKTDFDESIGRISIIPQDIGRVILNVITNAFYTVNEKKKQKGDGYDPIVSLTTKKTGDNVEIIVADNGKGMPQKVVDKIFQPFFTTKPTGQGTGLGLSLAYDIVKAHGGEIKVETKEGEGSEFIIQLPIV